MKLNLKRLAVMASLSLFMTGCTDSPQDVGESFMRAVASGKIEEAKLYCTETTAKSLDFASQMGALKIDPDYDVVCLRDSIVGNTAYVYYLEKGCSKEGRLTLYKIDGEWKVNMEGKK